MKELRRVISVFLLGVFLLGGVAYAATTVVKSGKIKDLEAQGVAISTGYADLVASATQAVTTELNWVLGCVASIDTALVSPATATANMVICEIPTQTTSGNAGKVVMSAWQATATGTDAAAGRSTASGTITANFIVVGY